VVPALAGAFAADPDIVGFMPVLSEVTPAMNPRTNLVEPAVVLAGLDPAALDRFGGLRLVGGGRADLSVLDGSTVYVNERAADKLEARPGDTVQLFVQGVPHEFRVAGIVEEERASGAFEFGAPNMLGGIALSLQVLQELVGRPGQINGVNVALYGDIRSSMARTDAAAERLEALNGDEARRRRSAWRIAFQVEKNKQDAVEIAVQAGNAFTTIFLVMGLFSIAAG
jgi:putative ABC transport system permease protein